MADSDLKDLNDVSPIGNHSHNTDTKTHLSTIHSSLLAPHEDEPQTPILTPSSPSAILLPTRLLTTHSRLFANLNQDPTLNPLEPLDLNIDHETFLVFARWLTGGRIHVPQGDTNGHATDLYLLMRAHAAGEALGADVFADMVMDEVIGELVREDDEGGKKSDLEILLAAAAGIWPAGSLGRELIVDWFVFEAGGTLSVEAVVEIGDLDLAARCMMRGKERLVDLEMGGWDEATYVVDPCRYHGHRREGKPCYKRSRDSAFNQLEFVIRCGIGGYEEDEDGDSGFGSDGSTLREYEACVGESMGLLNDEKT